MLVSAENDKIVDHVTILFLCVAIPSCHDIVRWPMAIQELGCNYTCLSLRLSDNIFMVTLTNFALFIGISLNVHWHLFSRAVSPRILKLTGILQLNINFNMFIHVVFLRLYSLQAICYFIIL